MIYNQPRTCKINRDKNQVQCRSRRIKRRKSNLEIPTSLKNVQLRSTSFKVQIHQIQVSENPRKWSKTASRNGKNNNKKRLTPGNVFLLWKPLITLSASSLEGHVRKQHPTTIPEEIRVFRIQNEKKISKKKLRTIKNRGNFQNKIKKSSNLNEEKQNRGGIEKFEKIRVFRIQKHTNQGNIEKLLKKQKKRYPN